MSNDWWGCRSFPHRWKHGPLQILVPCTLGTFILEMLHHVCSPKNWDWNIPFTVILFLGVLWFYSISGKITAIVSWLPFTPDSSLGNFKSMVQWSKEIVFHFSCYVSHLDTISKIALHCFPSAYVFHSFPSPTRDVKTPGVVWGLVSIPSQLVPFPLFFATFPLVILFFFPRLVPDQRDCRNRTVTRIRH